MQLFQHLVVDKLIAKCCFSRTMKRDLMRLLAGILAITGLFSCSEQGGAPPATYKPSPDGMRAGDSATSRNSIDAIINNPSERPGLATGWGHEKNSPVYGRGFVRASSKPAGVDSIYYNNPEGIDAMAGNMARVDSLQSAAGGLVEWGIKGRLGYLPTYKDQRGYGRRLVAGQKGGTYSIFIRNRSKSALEIVASVDGLDVQDGKTASFSKRGYLVDAGDTLEIDGFRTSYSAVAAFKFSGVADSYANLRHGDTRNVGVIGLAVFTQKGVNPWTWTPPEVHFRDNAKPFAEAP